MIMPTALALVLARGEFGGVLLDAVLLGLRTGKIVRTYGGKYKHTGAQS